MRPRLLDLQWSSCALTPPDGRPPELIGVLKVGTRASDHDLHVSDVKQSLYVDSTPVKRKLTRQAKKIPRLAGGATP